MQVYIGTILIIMILEIMEQSYFSYKKNIDKQYEKKSKIFDYLLIITFLIVGGFRYYVGTDFGGYYKSYSLGIAGVISKFLELDEPGIYLLTFLCRSIWNEGIFVIFIENAIIVLLTYKGIKDYRTRNLTVPFLLFFFFGGWLFSLNGIRQAIAASIIFGFSKKSEKHWILKYMIVVFIAFLFHKTALFMFPILILANRKIDLKQLFLIAIVGVFVPYFGNKALGLLGITFLETNEYMVREINPLRVLVAFAPLALLVLLRLYHNKRFFIDNVLVTNMVMINAILTAMTANSAYMNRFATFTGFFTMVFLSKFADRLTSKSRKVYYFIILVLYFIYFVYEINTSGSYLPFRWSFKHFGEY